MTRAVASALLALASAVATSAAPAVAAERVMLVLDASGSMWGRIAGETKVEIARRVLDDVLGGLDEALEVGLVAYGHRRRGDCADIETVLPAARLDRARLMRAVRGLSARGKTPLSAAVLHAAEELRYTEERATVVLVSDGEETCELDPCAVGAELERTGTDFVAHVIGFDVADPVARAQLQCLATNTGGRFLTAADAQELAVALREVAVEIAAPPAPEPAPEPEPPPVTAALEAPEAVAPGREFEVGWQGPGLSGDRIVVARKGQGPGEWVGNVAGLGDNPVRLEAPETLGEYELRYLNHFARPERRVLASRPLRVEAKVALEAPEAVAPGREFEVGWQGPGLSGDRIVVARKGQGPGEWVGNVAGLGDNPVRLEAPETLGEYELRYLNHFARPERRVLASRPLRVEAKVALEAPEAVAPGREFEVGWQGPGLSGDRIVVARKGQGPGEWVGNVAGLGDNPVRLEAPETLGEYELRYLNHFARPERRVLASRPLRVEAKVALEAPEAVAPGREFEVGWQGPRLSGDRIDIARKGQEPGQSVAYAPAQESPARLKAPDRVGEYELRYFSHKLGQLATQPLRVKADVRLEAPEAVAPGREFEVRWEGPGLVNDRIEIARKDQEPGQSVAWAVAQESPARLKAPDRLGEYELRYFSPANGVVLGVEPLRVEAKVALEAPEAVAPGREFEVRWEGPGLVNDRIEIARKDQEPGQSVAWAVAQESPARLKAPDRLGEYELRYFSPANGVLASRPLRVAD